MRIRNFMHKGLKRLYDEDSPRAVPAAAADKLRKMLALLDSMESEDDLKFVPSWRAHQLTGSRLGTWSSRSHGTGGSRSMWMMSPLSATLHLRTTTRRKLDADEKPSSCRALYPYGDR